MKEQQEYFQSDIWSTQSTAEEQEVYHQVLQSEPSGRVRLAGRKTR